MSSHIFGGGVPHPLTESFIGDFLTVAKTNVSLGYEYDPSPFRAAHAGADAGGDPDTVDFDKLKFR